MDDSCAISCIKASTGDEHGGRAFDAVMAHIAGAFARRFQRALRFAANGLAAFTATRFPYLDAPQF